MGRSAIETGVGAGKLTAEETEDNTGAGVRGTAVATDTPAVGSALGVERCMTRWGLAGVVLSCTAAVFSCFLLVLILLRVAVVGGDSGRSRDTGGALAGVVLGAVGGISGAAGIEASTLGGAKGDTSSARGSTTHSAMGATTCETTSKQSVVSSVQASDTCLLELEATAFWLV